MWRRGSASKKRKGNTEEEVYNDKGKCEEGR